MAQRIPVTNDVRQTFSTILGTQKVRLRIYYVADTLSLGAAGWFCDLILLTDTPQIIVTGERLLTATQVAKDIITDFSGAIFVVPVTSPPQALNATEPWNITHQLVYFTAAELAASD